MLTQEKWLESVKPKKYFRTPLLDQQKAAVSEELVVKKIQMHEKLQKKQKETEV
jgi:hypothetical protein